MYNKEFFDQILTDLIFIGALIMFVRAAWTIWGNGKMYVEFSFALRNVSEDVWKYVFPNSGRSDVRTPSRWREMVEKGFLNEHPVLRPFAERYEWYVDECYVRFFECILYMLGSIVVIIIYNIWLRPAS